MAGAGAVDGLVETLLAGADAVDGPVEALLAGTEVITATGRTARTVPGIRCGAAVLGDAAALTSSDDFLGVCRMRRTA